MLRVLELMLTEKAYMDLKTPKAERARQGYSAKPAQTDKRYSKVPIGYLERSLHDGSISFKWKTKKQSNMFHGPLSEDDLVSSFSEHVFPNIEENRIALFVSMVSDNVKYSANPCYGSKNAARQDWALLNYGRNIGEVACHTLLFFHLPSKPIRAITLNDSFVNAAGHYVCCHVLPTSLSMQSMKTKEDDHYYELAHPDQRLIFRVQKWDIDKHGKNPEYNMIIKEEQVTPSLRFESCNNISGPIIAIPDFYANDNFATEKDSNHIFYVIRQHAEWAPDFAQYAREHVEKYEEEDDVFAEATAERRKLLRAVHARR
jgi:hypothetical protein